MNESKEARTCEERVGKRAECQGPWACASEQWETALDPGRECLDHLVTTLEFYPVPAGGPLTVFGQRNECSFEVEEG